MRKAYRSALLDFARDSQIALLLDMGGIIGLSPPRSDRDYLPRPPTAKAFADCCNEFWWVAPNVAEGALEAGFAFPADFIWLMHDG